jgi:predicted metal-dependent TIM-barrel fold hydrolase
MEKAAQGQGSGLELCEYRCHVWCKSHFNRVLQIQLQRGTKQGIKKESGMGAFSIFINREIQQVM